MIDQVLAELEALTGITAEQATEQARRREHGAAQSAKDAAAYAERLARAKRKARRKAAIAYGFWQRHHNPADFEEWFAEQRRVRQLDAELREVLCHDQALIDEVTRKAAQ
jgi:hypothetical protein